MYKTCSRCNIQKLEERDFSWHIKAKDKRYPSCKDCCKEIAKVKSYPSTTSDGRKAYRVANAEKINAAQREAYSYNKELAAAKRKAKREIAKCLERDHRNNNPFYYAHKSAKRRATILQATPPWANMKLIEGIYKIASELGLEVDHIYPLQGENSCGLHVHYNLQLMTKSANSSKGNRVSNV